MARVFLFKRKKKIKLIFKKDYITKATKQLNKKTPGNKYAQKIKKKQKDTDKNKQKH